jgi:hypothetical protein
MAEETSATVARILTEGHDEGTLRKTIEQVSQLLTSGEEILYVGTEKRPVVDLSPDSIVLTTRRILFYRPQLLGRVSFEDCIWRDVEQVTMEENILGATVRVRLVDGRQMMMEYLPKAQARKVYSIAQDMEERVREERRMREIEEKRAGAGGVVFHGPSGHPAAAPAPPNPVEKLKQLKAMLDASLISAEEYEKKKQEILSSM